MGHSIVGSNHPIGNRRNLSLDQGSVCYAFERAATTRMRILSWKVAEIFSEIHDSRPLGFPALGLSASRDLERQRIGTHDDDNLADKTT